MSCTVFRREKESNPPDLFDNARNTPAKECELKFKWKSKDLLTFRSFKMSII